MVRRGNSLTALGSHNDASLAGRPVSDAEGARFAQAWNIIQARFVDDPKGVVAEADQLLREILRRCGYAMDEFEQRPGHTLLDHSTVVTTYLAARAVTFRHAREEPDTEVLRKAVLYYRTLFNELLPRSLPAARAAKATRGGTLLGTHSFPVRSRPLV